MTLLVPDVGELRSALRFLEVEDAAQGIVVRPHSPAIGWVIEAIVWLTASGCAAAMLAFGRADWMRVLGALILVPVGLRAVLRTVRFFSAKWLRALTVAFNSPQPFIAGPLVRAQLDAVVRFEVARTQGDLYFCAFDAQGRATHLVTLEPDHEPDYRKLAAWLATRRT
jgi:hypothetical protein